MEVLSLHCEPRPLQAKGFDIVWLGPRVEHGELKAALANANQFWLISGGAATLSDSAIEVIVEEWRSGMGMYVQSVGGLLLWQGKRMVCCTRRGRSRSRNLNVARQRISVGDCAREWIF